MQEAPDWSDWQTDWQGRVANGTLSEAEARRLLTLPFLHEARASQRPPPGSWRTWLFMGGRGSGKTRAGAEWARFAAMFGRNRRLALVGPTLSDVREVMIEGPSGLRRLESRFCDGPPRYESSRRRLTFPNGAEAFAFSAEDPDSLRGPQFDAAWCDELAAWAYPDQTWDMLQMALRLGRRPRAMVTTTPRPIALVRRLVADPACAVTRSATADNAANLAPGFVDALAERYGGTSLGRQELDGELLDAPEGAIWSRAMLAACRCGAGAVPGVDHTLVAIDPPAGAAPSSDACGIIAAGGYWQDGRRHAVILADDSARGLRPLAWARQAVALAERVGAYAIVAEANQGGAMVEEVLRSAGCLLPVRLVHARLGKRERAGPVAALYEQGRVAHAAAFPALEDEMASFGSDGFTGSPDRLDALVWAVWALVIEARDGPRLRAVW